MVSALIREFLESSTIHGLAQISTAKSLTARAVWTAIVVVCFAFAVYMITDSYKEWQESPVLTTITTHPINELEFPTVTVCPPRGSNTVLNHLLEKVQDVNFSEEERQELLSISKEIFIEIPSKKFIPKMTELLDLNYKRSIANEQASLPEVDDQGVIILRSYEPQGSFSSPRLEHRREPVSFRFELNFPEDVGGLLGEGEMIINVNSSGNWSYFAPNNKTLFYQKNFNMSAAEDYCVSNGGHLASIGSQEENVDLLKAANGSFSIWLGGRRTTGKKGWEWLDGKEWTYQNWGFDEPNKKTGYDCMYINFLWKTWYAALCQDESDFICVNQPQSLANNERFVFSHAQLTNQTLHFLWNDIQTSDFNLDWHIENGNIPEVRELVSKDLVGSVSSPESSPNNFNERDEYAVVLELPHNITEIIKNGAMVIDIFVTSDNQNEVEILTRESKLEYVNTKRNWSAAEYFCQSKGGHLASVSSNHHWNRLRDFIADNDLGTKWIWIGGNDKTEEGKWIWSDGTQWSVEHWGSNQPNGKTFENCLLTWKNDWIDDSCHAMNYFICSVPSKLTTTINYDYQIIFTSENISVPAIQIRYGKQGQGQSKNSSSTAKNLKSRFNVDWKLVGSTHAPSNDKNYNGLWKAENHFTSPTANANMMTIMNIVHESKMLNIRESKVWKTILKHRWNIEILKTNPCPNETQIAEVIFKTTQDLQLTYESSLWIPDEDLALGLDLYSVLHYCPSKLVEAAKLAALFESILIEENLNTVVAATVHNIQPGANDNVKDFTEINKWYKMLNERYNLTLAPNIYPLLMPDDLSQLKLLLPPFITGKDLEDGIDFTRYGEGLAQVSHPPHLRSSWISAFIPFCAYKTDLNFSKSNHSLPDISFPLCSSFTPTILEGQLCYKIVLNDSSGQGQGNELMLILDYNNDLSVHIPETKKKKLKFKKAFESMQDESAKIHINTLSPNVGFGGGRYLMTAVKRMTVKADFLKMPSKDRNCEVESYEDCRTKKLLRLCNCAPWEGMEICGPEGRRCIQKNSANTFNCSTTCQGIYADVQRDKAIIEEEVMENLVSNNHEKESNERVDIKLEKRLAFIENQIRLLMKNGGTKQEFDKEEYRMLTAEYRRFKEKNVKHLKFNSESASTSFGEELAPSTLQLVQIYFDTATFDNIERDKKIKTEAQLSLIGGTMGLLTGFSIISGVEIIFFIIRLVSSFRITRN